MRNRLWIKLVPFILWSVVAFSAFLPEKFWGVHFIAFLSQPVKISLLIISLFLVVYPFKASVKRLLEPRNTSLSTVKIFMVLLFVSLAYGTIIWNFPIAVDEYGDAYRYQAQLNNTIKELPRGFVKDLFAFEVTPSSGRKFVLFFIGFLSYKLQLSYGVLFKWIGLVAGVGFCFAWLRFVMVHMKTMSWQIVLGLVGLFAPFTQMFYNHVESYPIVFLFFFLWIIWLLGIFRKRDPLLVAGLLVFWLLLQRLHPMAWLLLPAWLLGLLHQINLHGENVKWNLTRVSYVIIGLTFIVGLFVYFFVLKDHKDLRFLEDVTDMDRLFLPIMSPPEPLDRYNLLSWNHILDFMNSVLHWSLPAISLLLLGGLVLRKRINWKTPQIVALSTSLLLMSALLFVTNPLNSMPMDWDLFSFPALILLVLVVLLMAQIEDRIRLTNFIAPTLALVLITTPFVFVNANTISIANRLGQLGSHVFKTYYIHSNRIVIAGASQQTTYQEYLDFKTAAEEKLKPWAIIGNDRRYANLLMDDGYLLLTRFRDYSEAERRLEIAFDYDSTSANIRSLLYDTRLFTGSSAEISQMERYDRIKDHGVKLLREYQDMPRAISYFQTAQDLFSDSLVFTLYLIEARFRARDYNGAYFSAMTLVDAQYPDVRKSLRVAIHCALEAKLYDEALKNANAYLNVFPNDDLILEVKTRLTDGDRISQLRNLFQSG